MPNHDLIIQPRHAEPSFGAGKEHAIAALADAPPSQRPADLIPAAAGKRPPARKV